jgi:methoxymalonate biosynthesis acyl carrier protein
MSEDARTAIRGFISSSFPHTSVIDDQDLFELGFVNSLFTLELLTFIENRFGVHVRNEDMRQENFHSVNAMASLIDRLSATVPATRGGSS